MRYMKAAGEETSMFWNFVLLLSHLKNKLLKFLTFSI